ncbi:calcium-binding protein [Streptomyces sp. NBC_01537]|uniref:calcium-binding protein n=1 Tax=Streptomyces sp. NBC_01537 TaxID=2903896 RepID=UPI0038680DAB
MKPMPTLKRLPVAIATGLALVLAVPGVATAAPGDLDPGFGTGGKVVTAVGSDVRGVAVQGDGKIVAVGNGSMDGFGGDFAVTRYNPNGSLDTGFGTGGTVFTDIGGGADEAHGLALQSNGKIVVVGRSENFEDGGCCWFTLVRYNPDGSLDTTFGTGGKVVAGFGGGGADDGNAVAIQSGDQKIVAAGMRGGGDFEVVRFDTNGAPDTGFGTGGLVTTDFAGGADVANGLALQSDGRIVAAGYTGDSGGNYDFALARYNTNGTLDTGFGTGGRVTTAFKGFEMANGVVAQADGRIVAAGFTGTNVGGTDDFALARYNTNGTPDTGFGTGGKVTTDSGGADQAYAVALQSDARIVAAGRRFSGGDSDFELARYNPDGTPDTGFGSSGLVTTGFGGYDQANAVAVQPDGRIVAAGTGQPGGSSEFALARYVGGGAPPPPPPAGVDLSVTKTGPATVALGDPATYTVTVTNTSATTAATNVTLRDTLTGPGSLTSATPGQGTCTTTATTATCSLGTLAPGAHPTITLVTDTRAAGTLSDTATVSATQSDPTPANNTATANTTVTNPRGCTVIGTAGADNLVGTSGNDVICGLAGNDTISSAGGNDAVYGDSGNDSADGGNGNDTLYGGPGNDVLNGNYGDDRLNTVDGVSGNDMALGGPGFDTCTTDPGDTRNSCP